MSRGELVNWWMGGLAGAFQALGGDCWLRGLGEARRWAVEMVMVTESGWLEDGLVVVVGGESDQRPQAAHSEVFLFVGSRWSAVLNAGTTLSFRDRPSTSSEVTPRTIHSNPIAQKLAREAKMPSGCCCASDAVGVDPDVSLFGG